MASTYDGARIEVVNWTKYNPRTTSKKPSWFRLDNNFLTGQKYFDLNASEKLLGVLLMSLVSQANGAPIVLNYDYLKTFTKLSDEAISKALKIYIDRETLHVTRTRHVRATRVSGIVTLRDSHATDGRTDGHNEQDITDETDSAEPDASASCAPAEPFVSNLRVSEILRDRKVTTLVQASWIEAYPEPPWIIQEVFRAISWEESNPGRRKKNFGRFMGNWLARGWDRRSLPNQGPRGFNRTANNKAALEEYLGSIGESA